MKETWKYIFGTNKTYSVSNNGRVRSNTRKVNCPLNGNRVLRNRILKKVNSAPGYYSVNVGPDRGIVRIHTLVAEAFIKRLPYHECVNHLDGDKHNNNVSNLEWVTFSENSKHAFRTGLNKNKLGFDNKLSKQVVCTKDLVKVEYGSIKLAAILSGVDYAAIWRSCNGIYKQAGGYNWTFKSL